MEKFRSIPTINLVTAREAASAALKEGEKAGVRISVCIVDPGMGLVAFARADGATPHSVETSRRKADTAASTGKPTGWMGPNLEIALPMGSGNRLTNLGGGVPIRFSGVLVGGLGIAGGTVEQDSLIAREALRAVGADSIE